MEDKPQSFLLLKLCINKNRIAESSWCSCSLRLMLANAVTARGDKRRKKKNMIHVQAPSLIILQILADRLQNVESVVEVDYYLTEFDDVRYHIQSSISDPCYVELSISLLSWSQESIFPGGLPAGTIEAVRGAYGSVIQIIDPPEEGFQLTLALDLAKLPLRKENRLQVMRKIASLRAVVLGARMREVLKHLASKIIAPDASQVITLIQRPKESLFIIPLPEKVIVVLPVHFNDSCDAVLATSFLQEFVEAKHNPGLNKAPTCVWSQTPPLEMNVEHVYTLSANAGFLSFVIFRHHIEGDKLDKAVWILSSFHAYINYHLKCSKGFMHTLMRRRAENMIQALDRAKIHVVTDKKKTQGLRCVQKLLRRPQLQTSHRMYGYHARQINKVSVPIQIEGVKQHQRKHIWWRCLKIPKISSLRKYKR